MIQIVLFHNQKSDICGFRLFGHAGYAEEGADIVCSAVTVLTLNTVNAIEALTKTAFTCDADEEEGGYLDVVFPDIKDGEGNHDAQLLLQAMALGLENMTIEYDEYIKLRHEEV